ncbi:hypothetical protein FOA52_009705 [Chlamydomonas sp. UWO 241]|nr:hypothetical protein FOA52_009705 [Chlamydomonas sp. UWO 241]
MLGSKRRSADAPEPAGARPDVGDRAGVFLYADFQECLSNHKGHAFAGIALVTLPIAYYKQTMSPVLIGFMMGFVPDLLYANWRCDDKYRAFRVHTDALLRRQEQQQQQQQAQQQQQTSTRL